ncbi:MAG TPA: acetate/propionate family kinase [Candidatus Angelobacter sp.]|nr:acetate/propionate family kinase [Candidatus Angelobacter sp.]
MGTERLILSLNGGSSSLKFSVYRMDEKRQHRVLSGAAEEIGEAEGRFWLRSETGDLVSNQRMRFADHPAAMRKMFAALKEQGIKDISAAGHRIVHGGPSLFEPHLVDRELLKQLAAISPFAPLHLPIEIALIETVAAHYPELPQVTCFDTAFHQHMPEVAQRLPLPRELWEKGVMRYGFHGLSYEYIVDEFHDLLGARTVIAHLGNGASMVALRDCHPIDTSMGLTPTGGFMMSTRTGDIDPGVLLFLLRQGYGSEKLAEMVDRQSGLLGVSGVSSDMKTLLQARDSNASAAEAVEMFCYQVKKFIGAYAAVLGGLDTVVFTGGIGERAAEVRAEICRGLGFLGIEIDEEKNSQAAALISRPESRCVVRVLATDEDLMIARHTYRLIQQQENEEKPFPAVSPGRA